MKKILWLMGLSGSGKTTIARQVKERLGEKAVLLDSDELRPTMNSDLGWTKEARSENARRYAELAKVIAAQGHQVVVCCITPTEEQRALVASILGEQALMVWLECPLEVCKVRRPSDVYADAALSVAGVNFPAGSPSPQDEPKVRIFSSWGEEGLNVFETIFNEFDCFCEDPSVDE
jgi:adenylylsulfate kinase-like enzyme